MLCRLSFAAALLLVGCASVPKEVVELSYVQSRDIAAVHLSYRQLIQAHFDDLRGQRIAYVEQVWAPRYVEEWLADGRLQDLAAGRVVWSRDKKDFVPPTPGQEQAQLAQSVTSWSKAAVKQIDKKRKELLTPLDRDEQKLLASVDEAFNQLLVANATITAHLNSIQDVERAQDDVLKALSIEDLRAKLNKGLAEASASADKGLEALEKLERDASDLADKADVGGQ